LGNFDEAEITIHSRKTTLMIEKILLRIFIYLSDDLNRSYVVFCYEYMKIIKILG